MSECIENADFMYRGNLLRLFGLQLRSLPGLGFFLSWAFPGRVLPPILHESIKLLSGGFFSICFLSLWRLDLVCPDHSLQFLVRNLGFLVLPDVFALFILAFQDQLRHDRGSIRQILTHRPLPYWFSYTALADSMNLAQVVLSD